MDKMEYNVYENSSNDEKFNYLINILEIKNGIIYGKVVGENKSKIKKLYIQPYGINQKRAEAFLDERKGWGIQALKKDKNIAINDYVRGRLVLTSEGPALDELEKMESFEAFREKLTALLKEKWEREGFTFTEEEIVKYDGKIAFDKWAAQKVEAMLEEKYEAYIQGEIQTQEQYLKDVKADIEKEKTNLQDIKIAYGQEEKRLEKLTEKNKEAEETYAHYEELGIISKEENVINNKKDYIYNTYEKLIQEVWTYLWREKNLYYEKFIVQQFMNALRTQQLIMLWGRPGTGKTSLPRAVAEAIGAECVCIQVQSNWTDNQDILGFYNIVDKRYVSTPFLDALIEADKHQDKLYFILLDEMNLSHVEYYFSEMLNVFTWDEPYKLQLYSKRLRDNIDKELKEAELQGKNISELVAIRADMEHYKPEFTIPSNVRFIGTLNIDATTKTISPKVIDRSCLIELQSISRETKETEQENLLDLEEVSLNKETIRVENIWFDILRTPLLLQVVSVKGTRVESESSNEEVFAREEISDMKAVIEEIKEMLCEANIFVSNRINAYINQWFTWEDSCVNLDEIVLAKILPMIDLENTSRNREVLKNLNEIFEENDCEKSKMKLEAMLKEDSSSKKRIIYLD